MNYRLFSALLVYTLTLSSNIYAEHLIKGEQPFCKIINESCKKDTTRDNCFLCDTIEYCNDINKKPTFSLVENYRKVCMIKINDPCKKGPLIKGN